MLRIIGARSALTVVLVASLVVTGCTVQLRTRPDAVSACEGALMVGTLARSGETGAGLFGADGMVHPVEWPGGFSARIGITGLELMDETGATIAHEGDRISIGGGDNGQGVFVACPGSVEVVERRID